MLRRPAFAALGKNTVGPKQSKLANSAVTATKLANDSVTGPKKNAVTTAKIKKSSVKQGKLAQNSVGGSQLIDGAVTGAKIEAASTPFSRVVATVKQSASQSLTPGTSYSIGSYTQPVGEDDVYAVGVDINFSAACVAPRLAVVYVLLDAENPLVPTPVNEAGWIQVEDKGVGEVTRRASPGPFPGGFAALTQPAPLSPTMHRFDLYLAGSSCSSGSGVNVTGATVEVQGTKSG